MSKINWKFYRPYRDKLVDKKNENEEYSLSNESFNNRF